MFERYVWLTLLEAFNALIFSLRASLAVVFSIGRFYVDVVVGRVRLRERDLSDLSIFLAEVPFKLNP